GLLPRRIDVRAAQRYQAEIPRKFGVGDGRVHQRRDTGEHRQTPAGGVTTNTGRTVRYAAPGRINLIGEHTDYNLGFALRIALPQRTVAAYTPDGSDTIVVRSEREDSEIQIPLDTMPGEVTGWAAYAAGVMWALRRASYRVMGGRMSIASDVEMGSGL